MAVAVKSPARERLLQLIEQKRVLAKRVIDLEDALPVVADVVALAKQKKALEKELEQLRMQAKELNEKRAKLALERKLLLQRLEQLEKMLKEYENLAGTGATTSKGKATGEGEEEPTPPQTTATSGSAGIKGTPQPSLT